MKTTIVAAALAAGLVATGSVSAGAHRGSTVVIGPDIDNPPGLILVHGRLGPVRNQPGSTEFIGCSVETAANSSRFAICTAVDANGQVAICSDDRADVLGMLTISGVSTASRIQFEFPSATLECTQIEVINSTENFPFP
ncbi:MAG: hypothetical protein JSR66_02300 [Proteobacteria bacterium]|nr:hypothetical protein [Pseudomonadota bacterium]